MSRISDACEGWHLSARGTGTQLAQSCDGEVISDMVSQGHTDAFGRGQLIVGWLMLGAKAVTPNWLASERSRTEPPPHLFPVSRISSVEALVRSRSFGGVQGRNHG